MASAAVNPTGVTFDAPLQQGTTVNVPAGVSFDAPLSKPQSVSVLQQQWAQGQPSQQSYIPTAKVSAAPGSMPGDSLASKITLWANNLKDDLMHGSEKTDIGHLYKAMGGQPLTNGQGEGVGEFMGSPVLGTARAVKGVAETTQHGQRWQGVKDVVGGALDASSIPGSFVSPEAGELAGQGADAALAQAGRAARAVGRSTHNVKTALDGSAIQPEFQQGVRAVLNTVAKEAGVTPSPASSIRDVAGQVADAILTRSKAAYSALDTATGGRVQRFDDALRNLNQRIRETAGLDDEQENALIQRKAEVETALEQAFRDAQANGVDPKLIDAARKDWKQAQALYDLDSQLKMSTSGMRPELAKPGSTPELLDPKKAFLRLNKLYDSGRLQQAAGDHASELIQHADTAFLHSQKIAARQQALRTAGKVAGTGAAVGAIGQGVSVVKGLVSNDEQ